MRTSPSEKLIITLVMTLAVLCSYFLSIYPRAILPVLIFTSISLAVTLVVLISKRIASARSVWTEQETFVFFIVRFADFIILQPSKTWCGLVPPCRKLMSRQSPLDALLSLCKELELEQWVNIAAKTTEAVEFSWYGIRMICFEGTLNESAFNKLSTKGDFCSVSEATIVSGLAGTAVITSAALLRCRQLAEEAILQKPGSYVHPLVKRTSTGPSLANLTPVEIH